MSKTSVLPAVNLADRKIGGSDAAIIMHGQHYEKTVLDLWLEKTGQKQPEDLSWKLPVQIGTATEALNRRWYTRETGNRVVVAVESFVHPDHAWMTANLDGEVGGGIIFEAKHVGPFGKTSPSETYYPQVQHYMAVRGARMAHLSVFRGTMDWNLYEVPRDDAYIAELIARESAFWFCVESMTSPPGWEPKSGAPPAPPTRTVDMTGNNEWASSALDWISHKDAARKYEVAKKNLTGLVESDVARAWGHGIVAVRDGRGLTIKQG